MKHSREFDYVVVGAGTAGCVVACRLAATGASVALRLAAFIAICLTYLCSQYGHCVALDGIAGEIGPSPKRRSMDAAFLFLARRQIGRRQLGNQRDDLLPGPSCELRPVAAPSSRPVDVPAWNFEALLPYFRRSEDFEGGKSLHHGTGGPIGVSASRYRTALADAFLRGCEELGIRRRDDFNSGEAEGASYLHVSQRHGRRTSSARYLHFTSYLSRPTVLLRSPVRRIVFERGGALGVEVGVSGRHSLIRAGREVIISAGAVRSPQLLMLSGVGPANSLRSLGIEVVADSPGVGANLRDNVRVPVAYSVRASVPRHWLRSCAVRFSTR